MIGSRLKNKTNKSKGQLKYFEKLSFDCNFEPFWKAWKPYFANKNSNIQGNKTLLEKDKLLSKQKDVASSFNKHFGSITDSFNLFSWPEDTSMSRSNDPINPIIKQLSFHSSIKAIKKKFEINHKDHKTNHD